MTVKEILELVKNSNLKPETKSFVNSLLKRTRNKHDQIEHDVDSWNSRIHVYNRALKEDPTLAEIYPTLDSWQNSPYSTFYQYIGDTELDAEDDLYSKIRAANRRSSGNQINEELKRVKPRRFHTIDEYFDSFVRDNPNIEIDKGRALTDPMIYREDGKDFLALQKEREQSAAAKQEPAKSSSDSSSGSSGDSSSGSSPKSSGSGSSGKKSYSQEERQAWKKRMIEELKRKSNQ